MDILEITSPEDIPVSVDYFLTNSDDYQVPLFTVNFAVCELTYTFEVDPPIGLDGVSFNDSPD